MQRQFLESRVPLPTLLRCYNLLKASQSDSDEEQIAGQLLALLSESERPYITLIQQLIVCEERAFAMSPS